MRDTRGTVGKYGLGVRNNRGQRSIDFCKEKELIITNTVFQQYPRSQYTWVKPGDTELYQISNIIVKNNVTYTNNKAKLTWELIHAVTITKLS